MAINKDKTDLIKYSRTGDETNWATNFKNKGPTPPRMWSNYITASTAISLYNNSDTRLSEYLRESSYIIDRRPKKAKFRNASKKK